MVVLTRCGLVMWPRLALSSKYKPHNPLQVQILSNIEHPPPNELSSNYLLFFKDTCLVGDKKKKKLGSSVVVRNGGSNSSRAVNERRGVVIPEKLEPLWDDGCGTKSVKDYLDGARDMVRPDGGPPRWFCPVECGSPLKESPLLLFLPGIDGLGLGLIMHHKALGRVFEVRCLHIPVRDQTPYEGLVKLVEETIRLEHTSSPKRPIYLVGDSFGGCLALSVAARNPCIDLVLILVNPATFIGSSPPPPPPPPQQQQQKDLLSLFGTSPQELYAAALLLPLCWSLASGDLKNMEMLNPGDIINPTQGLDKLLNHLTSWFSRLPVLADIVPMESVPWKLNMLKSASASANCNLHAVEAEVLMLFSGKGNIVGSEDEALRLSNSIQNCQVRHFEDSGPCLLLEDGFNLLSVIKGTCKYRCSRSHDFVSDFLPPSSSEVEFVFDRALGFLREATSPVMLSTMEGGKIVKGLGGVPKEGPVMLVGNHMLLGLEMIGVVEGFLRENKVMVRGIAHPRVFADQSWENRRDIRICDHLKMFGAVPVSARNLANLLSTHSHVLLYPGGRREGLHCKGEEYKLFWPEEPEFVRMAARYGATIVPFGFVGEDDLLQVVVDYKEMMNIPVLSDRIRKLITDNTGRLREVTTNQGGGFVCPICVPKFPPGRFYYLFGEPIKTKGKENMLLFKEDKVYAKEFYMQVKSQVEAILAYLLDKREHDPYRNYVNRAMYPASFHRFVYQQQVPTFHP